VGLGHLVRFHFGGVIGLGYFVGFHFGGVIDCWD